MNSHLAPEDEPRIVTRATGPRREAPSRCVVCEAEYPERPFQDGTCGEAACRDAAVRR